MEIARSLETPLTDQPVVLTIGRFDGVHAGHQYLIRSTIEQARALGFRSAVLTWNPHPNNVIRPDQPFQLLTSLDERIERIAALEPDMLIVAPFTRETMTTSAQDYMAQICAALPVRVLRVGADFAMGHRRQGDTVQLAAIGEELGYTVEAVERRELAGDTVSSSRIRELLQRGDVAAANTLLGYNLCRGGVVVAGNQRGRTIGFPTANISVDPNLVLPADGVYACYAVVDGESLPAVTNIGIRPTFNGAQRTFETYILDWSGDLYGRTLCVQCIERLRGEQRFNGIAELVIQITSDVVRAREVLRR